MPPNGNTEQDTSSAPVNRRSVRGTAHYSHDGLAWTNFGPSLPQPRMTPCAAIVDTDTVFVAGGQRDYFAAVSYRD